MRRGRSANFIQAFKIYVRPIVEYIYYISCLVSVPSLPDKFNWKCWRSFTKRLPGFKDLTYFERLSKLNLKSLEYRRLISDLIICFQIARDFSSITLHAFFVPSSNPPSRGHQFRLQIPLAILNIRKSVFSNRVVSVWNSLPSSVVLSQLHPLPLSNLTSTNITCHGT